MSTHNITDFEKLPQEVKDYIHHLEQVRSDFVANVSHELRTPLTVLRGYLEALIHHEHPEKEALQKVYAQMFQQSLRMADLIEDLLLLAHLEGEDHPLEEKKEIPVKDMLQALCLDAKNISGEKQHVITLDADETLFLNGSENELRSLFSNIIVNAVKYTPAHGKIHIQWLRDKNHAACFSVSDTGIGIAKEDIPRITERFYRVDKARSRERGGTGLGLAIVKHVLLRHHAKLQIESKLGKGSQFICVFPEIRTSIKSGNDRI